MKGTLGALAIVAASGSCLGRTLSGWDDWDVVTTTVTNTHFFCPCTTTAPVHFLPTSRATDYRGHQGHTVSAPDIVSRPHHAITTPYSASNAHTWLDWDASSAGTFETTPTSWSLSHPTGPLGQPPSSSTTSSTRSHSTTYSKPASTSLWTTSGVTTSSTRSSYTTSHSTSESTLSTTSTTSTTSASTVTTSSSTTTTTTTATSSTTTSTTTTTSSTTTSTTTTSSTTTSTTTTSACVAPTPICDSIVDGGFECVSDDDLNGSPITSGGWTVDDGAAFEENGNGFGDTPYGTKFALLIGLNTEVPTVSQDISGLTVGALYTLDFDYSVIFADAPSGQICNLQAYLGDQFLAVFAIQPQTTDWTSSGGFISAAQATSGTLQFRLLCPTLEDLEGIDVAIDQVSWTANDCVLP